MTKRFEHGTLGKNATEWLLDHIEAYCIFLYENDKKDTDEFRRAGQIYDFLATTNHVTLTHE